MYASPSNLETCLSYFFICNAPQQEFAIERMASMWLCQRILYRDGTRRGYGVLNMRRRPW